MPINLELFSNHTIFQYTLLLSAALIGLELLSRIKRGPTKQIAVIVISMALLGWLDLWSLILLICLSVVVFGIVRARIDLQNMLYPLSLCLISILILIKDVPAFVQPVSPYRPLGVSYYFFRLISFLIEYSKNPEKTYEIPFLDYFSWVFFFPIFLAGPILRFNEFNRLDENEHQKRKPVFYRNFAFAVLLKILIVDMILFNFSYVTLQGLMEVKLSLANAAQNSIPNIIYLFIFAFSAFFHAYLDLMLYTEISKAMAGILGFTNVDNFNRPLLATNISEFWQKWHMSLSNWTRDYIFFPMLVKTRITWACTYASMLVIGIWHEATLNWIVWAIFHATAINMYGQWRKTKIFQTIAKYPIGNTTLKISGNIITVSFVGFVFIFVAIKDFSYVMHLLFVCFLGGR